jgi:hypothetical protein
MERYINLRKDKIIKILQYIKFIFSFLQLVGELVVQKGFRISSGPPEELEGEIYLTGYLLSKMADQW